MFEVESKGTMKDMVNLQRELLIYLGFDMPIETDYDDLCQKYGTEILEAEHETKMWDQIGDVVSLQKFPIRTNPFWNMKRGEDGKFHKVDVILFGQETIGSAERSCDPDEMRKMFYRIEDGQYSQKLFELFGEERVERELEEFDSLFFEYFFFFSCSRSPDISLFCYAVMYFQGLLSESSTHVFKVVLYILHYAHGRLNHLHGQGYNHDTV